MNPAVLDKRLFGRVIEALVAKRLRWDRYDVFFHGVHWLELWLDGDFPFAFHDALDARLAKAVPFSTQPLLDHMFEGFVDKNAAAETT